MKTISQIDAEIADVRNWSAGKTFMEKDQLDRLNFLRNCKFFLERAHANAEEHLMRQLNELKTKVEVIESGFKTWLDRYDQAGGHRKTEKAARGEYNKEMGMKNLSEQIGYLEFLLDTKKTEVV